jgi:sodium transport system permease protein
MRWPIIRLIWLRELRDQLRDRRTMFVMIVLPLLLYPLGGVALMQIAFVPTQKKSVIGIHGAQYLPPADGPREKSYPPLLVGDGSHDSFPDAYFRTPGEKQFLSVELLGDAEGTALRTPLEQGRVDLILDVPQDFQKLLQANQPVLLPLLTRPDDRSQLARLRIEPVLARWLKACKEVRLIWAGRAHNFDEVFQWADPDQASRGPPKPMQKIFDLLTRIFPFVLVLWSLAGALYPAVDICAGEKERGTMETLLISPAQREEIVWGKFLAIWVFSGVTAFLNLLSMSATTWAFSSRLTFGSSLNALGFLWCVVLLLPLSAFFSALCLAVGAYARSTKEGQYYLMPLFVLTMPLVFLTLVPGVELNAFYSMLPITGVSLLLLKLIQVGSPDAALWLYFVPVLVPMIIYSWMALRWAIIQFQREEVLFREAERVELGLWVRRLFREREPRPSAGQALFCFTVVLGLSWFSLGLGSELVATNIIRFLAFVATPTLLMAFLLTTQPRQSLAVRVPPVWSWGVALALVVVLTPVLMELTLFLLRLNPNLERLIEQYSPFTEWLREMKQGGGENGGHWWQGLVVFALLPAVCEELTFRGFILTGLQRRFRPRTAVLLSSFLFSLMQMNVFQFVPTFLVGVVLAYLTTRCGSILPAMLFHVLYNTLLLKWDERYLQADWQRIALGSVCLLLSGLLLWWLTRLRPHPAYVAFLQSDPGLEPPAPQSEPASGGRQPPDYVSQSGG